MMRAGHEMSAYDRLMGDATLFSRQDSAEAQWRIVEYDRGTRGPEEAAGIARNAGSWCDPLVASGPTGHDARAMQIRKAS